MFLALVITYCSVYTVNTKNKKQHSFFFWQTITWQDYFEQLILIFSFAFSFLDLSTKHNVAQLMLSNLKYKNLIFNKRLLRTNFFYYNQFIRPERTNHKITISILRQKHMRSAFMIHCFKNTSVLVKHCLKVFGITFKSVGTRSERHRY